MTTYLIFRGLESSLWKWDREPDEKATLCNSDWLLNAVFARRLCLSFFKLSINPVSTKRLGHIAQCLKSPQNVFNFAVLQNKTFWVIFKHCGGGFHFQSYWIPINTFCFILFQIPTPMLTTILLNAFTKKWEENAEESTTYFSAVWDIYLEVIPAFFRFLYTYQRKNFTSICMLFLDCIINLVSCCIVSRKKIFVFWNKVIGQPPQFIWFSTICRLRSQKKSTRWKEIVGTVISPISVSDYKLIGYFSLRFTVESG